MICNDIIIIDDDFDDEFHLFCRNQKGVTMLLGLLCYWDYSIIEVYTLGIIEVYTLGREFSFNSFSAEDFVLARSSNVMQV
jgi:hypothetical protein